MRLGPTFTSAQLARALGIGNGKAASRARIHGDLFEKVSFFEWRVRSEAVKP